MSLNMQLPHAFAAPTTLTSSHHRPSPLPRITRRKPRSHTIPPHSLLRRQRLRNADDHPAASPGPSESAPAPSGPDETVQPPSEADEADTSDDSVLPNLKELFSSGGAPGCEQCGGTGEIPCPVCQAQGFVSLTMMSTVSSAQCRMCRGGCRIPCPTCRKIVYKSVVWWDKVPDVEEDPEQKWKLEGGDDEVKFQWGGNPADPPS